VIYLRYDHSDGPGPRGDEWIGPFSDYWAAVNMQMERFSMDAPVSIMSVTDPPPAELTMTPEAFAHYQDQRL
jgi:hypothetical protein